MASGAVPDAIDFTWLYSDSFWARAVRARVAASFSWLSRDEDDVLLLVQRQRVLPLAVLRERALAVLDLLLLAGELPLEPVEHALRRLELDLQVLVDVLVDECVGGGRREPRDSAP